MTTELYANQPNNLYYNFMVEDEEVLAEDLLITVQTGNDRMDFGTPEIIQVDDEPMGETKYIIPNTLLHNYRYALIKVTYTLADYGDQKDEFIVPIVKRYISFKEINKILGDDVELTWDQYDEVERNVRLTIDSYCMQSFNSWYGTREVRSNSGLINLPQHLDNLVELAIGPSPFAHNSLSDPFNGFVLAEPGFDLVNEDQIKTITMFSGRPKKIIYNITGTWGYSSVPAVVRQAAIALFQSSLCDDKELRNRYIDNIRNENIRIQFRDETYTGESTGNAFVDDILAPYRIFYIGVV